MTVDKFAFIRMNNRFVEMVSSPCTRGCLHMYYLIIIFIYYILILIISMNYTRITWKKTVDKCVYTLSTLSTLARNFNQSTRRGAYVI